MAADVVYCLTHTAVAETSAGEVALNSASAFGDIGDERAFASSLHRDRNVATLGSIASIPGHSHWGLAPASVAWQGKSLQEISLQLKDAPRNGGRSLKKIHEHMATDLLVGWAWHPGEGRVPAPGTQARFGELVEAWVASGAYCPSY